MRDERGAYRWFRGGFLLVLAGLLLGVVGDRRAVTAVSRGIDPLEILNLKIKPNIIVVFDSSGSMRESPAGGNSVAGEVNFPLISGDWSGSKLFQAKQVLNTVIAANDQEVSFLFGRYTQQNSAFQNTGAGANRFSYTTQAWIVSTPPTVYGGPSPSMPTTQLTLQWEPVVINAQSNVFYYNEQGAILVPCAVTLPNGIYATTAEHNTLATAIATAMNGCPGRTAPANTYGVAWNSATRVFTITRTGGARTWQVILGGTNGAGNSVGFTASTALGNGAFSTTAPVTRGFQAFQDVQTGWNILNFKEGALPTCSVAITTGTYLSGAALAAEMQLQMNACPSRANLYDVTYLANAGTFRFSRRIGAANFSMYWGTAANSIRAVLSAGTTDTASGAGPFTTGASPLLLRRRTVSGTDTFTETFDPDGAGPVGNTTVYTYRMIAGRFWNGQTLNVIRDGTFCGFGATNPLNPPGLSLQEVSACGGGAVGTAVFFEFAGGQFGGNNISCNGFSTQVPLSACDSATSQITAINPYLQREIPLDANGNLVGYVESTNGAYSVTTSPPAGPPTGGGIVADGATPIAASLANIKTLFNGLWTTGQAASPGPPPVPALTPISSHTNPKERTIVLFVTDGNDTCAGGTPALVAANNAQRLYFPIVGGLNSNGTFTAGTDPASSVSTYMVGYGRGPSANLLNYIAWGGSGLGAQMCPANNCATWAAVPTAGQRAACKTCVDAFIAPDAATLATVVQSIINQGATSGDFTSQGSLVAYPFEYVGEVAPPPLPAAAYSPLDARNRYDAVVPILYRSRFSMPSFTGHLYAIDEVGIRWDAGQRLADRVQQGMASCAAGATGEGIFGDISDGGSCAINRRIYSTSRNGVFATAVDDLLNASWVQTNGNRVNLWPPSSSVDPASGFGILDAALGLPMADDNAAWTDLTTTYKACLGTGAPAACNPAGANSTRVPAAREEARRMILAYLAGAQVVLDSTTALPKRKASNPQAGELLYKARSWVLAESTLAEHAVLTQAADGDNAPQSLYTTEYGLFTEGLRTSGTNPQPRDGLLQGFGLTNPDLSGQGLDLSSSLNPVMGVVYVAANDMLHAFRAGPNFVSTSRICTPSVAQECGGEELWGFVPFDQLAKLKDLMKPQTRENKVYVMASPVRFTDVFVAAPGTTANGSGTFTNTIDGVTVSGRGVWRRLLVVGRGIAGKYYTTLDVTAPGDFTTLSTSAAGPVIYWSRGNPDTDTGLPSGSPATAVNHDAADYVAYSRMGETWSTAAVGYVNKLHSVRKPCPGGGTLGVPCSVQSGGGVEFVAFTGSGYSDVPTEGTTFYTLDLLTGDVLAAADVGSRVGGVTGAYSNALVASVAAWASDQLDLLVTHHPFNSKTTRAYVGDLHGRLWKFLASAPGTPILFQDLGVDQPIGAPVALAKTQDLHQPLIFPVTGHDSRATTATGQFRYFAFIDRGDDTDTSPPPNPQSCFPTVSEPCLYTEELRGASPMGGDFRGSAQPATFGDERGQRLRVTFVGTRFIPLPPGPLSTPVPPYPCRSRFDSIVFMLGAQSGGAAYDLNAGAADDRYVVFDNSKIVAVRAVIDPSLSGTGSSIMLDEGLYNPSAPEQKPPKKGPKPTIGGGLADVTAGSTMTGTTLCKY